MSEAVLKVEGLSKKFARNLKRSMIYGLTDIARLSFAPKRFQSPQLTTRLADVEKKSHTGNMISVAGRAKDGLRPSEFWALRDIDFELHAGDCIGVIGHNGAGKSTLFTILSGIIAPTTGRVEVHGLLQSLIALGAGFHPMLTGRENIYINANVFGLSNRKIAGLIDEVIDFSEIEDFIDMPIKHYSSGMMVRLGFSVAAHLNPRILLVDEVLAVGDLAFQNKSFAKMMSLIDSGVSLMFVSHYMTAIESVCEKVMWMEQGRVRMRGLVDDIVPEYIAHMEEVHSRSNAAPAQQKRDKMFPIRIDKLELRVDGKPMEHIRAGTPSATVRFHYECRRTVENPYFHLQIKRPQSSAFTLCCMHDDAVRRTFQPGRGYVDCELKSLPLALGPYELHCAILRTATVTVGQKFYHELFCGLRFRVEGDPPDIGRPGQMQALAPVSPPVLLDHHWTIRENTD